VPGLGAKDIAKPQKQESGDGGEDYDFDDHGVPVQF
jgi:hypothetical protein